MPRDGDDRFYRARERQELKASEKAEDPTIKRLHWEMAQRYAYLASEIEKQIVDTDNLSAGAAPPLHQQSLSQPHNNMTACL